MWWWLACTADDTPAPAEGVTLEVSGPVACPSPGSGYDTEWLPVGNPAVADIAAGGFVLADLTGDGLLDLVVAGEPAATFRGADGGRAFVPDPLGLDGVDLGGMVGGSAADVDGDGDLDLHLTRWERTDLLLRDDGGSFAEVALSAEALHSTTSAWDDFDGDGDLDLFVGRYGPVPDLDGDPGLHGDPDALYRNDGGAFTPVPLPRELDDGYAFMSAWYDLDNDGDRELFVVHDYGDRVQSRLLRNDGGALVVDDTAGFHPAFDGMGLGVGDVNDDGRPDLLQTSNRTISLLVSTDSAASATGALYVDQAQARGLDPDSGTASERGQDWGWGAELADLDNDGDQDAVALFGRWDTWFGSLAERDEIWRSDGFVYVRAAAALGLDWDAASRGLAVVDLDGDGTLDLLRRALDAPFRVDRGRCTGAAWLSIALADETSANAGGVGAHVDVTAGGRTFREWVGGSSGMFSGGPPVAHVGLGDAESVEELCVTWPDGERSCFGGVEPRQRVTVRRR